MAHERSETIERDGEYFNVSGVTGADLEGPFLSLDDAVASAQRRSSRMTMRGDFAPMAEEEFLAAQAATGILAPEPGFVGGGRASGVVGWGPDAQPPFAIRDDLEAAPPDFWTQLDDAFRRGTIEPDDYVSLQRQRVYDFESPLLQAQRETQAQRTARAQEAAPPPAQPEDQATVVMPPEGDGVAEAFLGIRKGEPPSAAPTAPAPSTAATVSQFLSGIGLQGVRPIEPAVAIVDAMYAGVPDKDRNPVYRTARNLAVFTDLALNAINVPATGVGDIANLVFAPITIGLRAAGFPEEDIQAFVANTRMVPELVAGMEMGLPPGTLAGKMGIVGNLTGATREVKQLVREVAGMGRHLRVADVAGLRDTAVAQGGRPTRVYHGTPAAFEQFDIGKASTESLVGPGFYFTESPTVASQYAESVSRTPEIAPNVRPAYLDIKRPFDMEATFSQEEIRRLADVATQVTGEASTGAWIGSFYRADGFTGEELYREFQRGALNLDKRTITQILQAAGYDGITHIGGKLSGTEPHRVWVAFHPEQVVSPFEVEVATTLSQVLQNEIGGARGPKEPPDTRSMARLFKLGVRKGGALWYHQFGDTLRTLYPGTRPFVNAAGETIPVPDADAAAGVIAALSPLRPAAAFSETGKFIENSNLETFRQVWEVYERDGYAGVERAIGPRKGHPERTIGMMKSQRENVLRALRGEQIGGKDALKIQNFKCALLGDPTCIVLDSWMKKIFYPEHKAPVWKQELNPDTEEWEFVLDAAGNRIPEMDPATGQQKMGLIGAFTPAQYRATAEIIRKFARRNNVQPSDVQAALWVAKKVEDEIAKAARKAAKSPRSLTREERALAEKTAMLGSQPFKTTLREVFEHSGMDLSAFKDSQEGSQNAALMFMLAQASLGAAVGGVQGETADEKIRNAMIGAGLGALVSPATVKLMMKATDMLRGKLSPEVASTAVRTTEGPLASAPAVRPHTPQTLAQQYADAVITARRGGPRTHPEVQAEAQALIDQGHVSMDTVRAIAPGTTLEDAHAVAVVKTLANSGIQLKALAQRALQTGDPDDVRAMMQQLYLHGQVDPQRIGIQTEAGRTLSAMNDPTSGMTQFLQQFELLLRDQTSGVDPQMVARAIADFKDPDQLAIVARQMSKPGAWGVFKEVYVNGLLSGPKTWMANMVGNTATTLWAIPERQLAEWMGAFREMKGGDPGVVQGEAWAMLHGVLGSVGDAWRLAWKGFKEGESQFVTLADEMAEGRRAATGKMELPHQRALSAESFDLTGPAGKAVDWLGNLVRFPSRVLVGTDDFFKVINYRAELRAQALRHATQEVAGRGLQGKAYADAVTRRMTQLMTDPPLSIKKAADDFALYQTFTNELGETGQRIQALTQTVGGKIVMPFVRTPLNITKYATDRTPLGLFKKSLRNDLMGNDLAKRDLAAAKVAMGSLTMGVAGLMAYEGLITGAGPTDPEMRRVLESQGWRPYSLKIGGQYVSYNRTEPIGMLLGLAADWTDAVANAEGDSRGDMFMDGATGIVGAIAKNLSSRTFVKGLAETMAFIADPERGGDVRASSFLMSLVPYSGMLRQTEAVMDPTLAEAGTIMERIRAQIPLLSDGVPPRRDLWGNKLYMTGVYGPIGVSPLRDDPVLKEIVASGANVPGLPDTVEERIALTPEERDQWAVRRGTMKLDGQTLKQSLSGLINTDDYKTRYSPERQAWEIELKIRQYTQAALVEIKDKNPDIQRSIDAARDARFRKRDEDRREDRPDSMLLRSLTR